MLDFKGKTALVTGGTRGIGRAIADGLEQMGARVFITGTQRQPRLKNYFQLDLNDNRNLTAFLKRLESFRRLDILVNNAGVNKIEPIDNITDEAWGHIIGVNLTGAMKVLRSAVRVMKRCGCGGRIVNISSIFGVVSKSLRSSYSTSKSGLIGLTRAAALDLAPEGIMVNALCPGFTLTDLTASVLSPKEIKILSHRIPLGRFAAPGEIAAAAIFLCSGANAYMTGQVLMVDGGYTAV